MRDRRTCEGMKAFEQQCLKKVLVFPKASTTWAFLMFFVSEISCWPSWRIRCQWKTCRWRGRKIEGDPRFTSVSLFLTSDYLYCLHLWKPPHDHKPLTQIRQDAGLVRSGRLFGGLLNDIKRKKPHYLSDFRSSKIELFNYSCWPRLMIVLMVFPK